MESLAGIEKGVGAKIVAKLVRLTHATIVHGEQSVIIGPWSNWTGRSYPKAEIGVRLAGGRPTV